MLSTFDCTFIPPFLKHPFQIGYHSGLLFARLTHGYVCKQGLTKVYEFLCVFQAFFYLLQHFERAFWDLSFIFSLSLLVL